IGEVAGDLDCGATGSWRGQGTRPRLRGRSRRARRPPRRRPSRRQRRALSSTVTGNSRTVRFPEASVALQVTRVVPRGKKLPEGGTHTTRGEGSRQSLAVTEKVTISPGALPSSSSTTTDDGKESAGGSRS